MSRGFTLSAIGTEDADELRGRGALQSFSAGTLLIQAGDRSGTVILLENGYVKATGVHGAREAVLSIHGPGEMLGELSLLDGHQHGAAVVALTAGMSLSIAVPEFWRFLSERPHLNRAVIATVTTRLRESNQQRAEQTSLAAVVRVAGRLLWLGQRWGVEGDDGQVIDVPLTQAELSSWAGVSRETGVRVLRQMRDAGYIRVERQRMWLTDRAALEQLLKAAVEG